MVMFRIKKLKSVEVMEDRERERASHEEPSGIIPSSIQSHVYSPSPPPKKFLNLPQRPLRRPLLVGRVVRAFSPSAEGVVEEVEGAVVGRLGGLRPLWEPLHEVDLALVLARPRALAWAAAACERHVPVLVACVPQGRVVVLQHDL